MSASNRLMEPRSYLSTAVRLGAGFALLFVLMTLASTALWSDRPLKLSRLAFQAVGGGMFYGLFMGTLLKGVTQVFPASDWSRFVAELNVATAQLGYRPSSVSDGFLEYSPRWGRGILAGGVSVQRRDSTAVIVGPRTSVNSLVTLLKVPDACASA